MHIPDRERHALFCHYSEICHVLSPTAPGVAKLLLMALTGSRKFDGRVTGTLMAQHTT